MISISFSKLPWLTANIRLSTLIRQQAEGPNNPTCVNVYLIVDCVCLLLPSSTLPCSAMIITMCLPALAVLNTCLYCVHKTSIILGQYYTEMVIGVKYALLISPLMNGWLGLLMAKGHQFVYGSLNIQSLAEVSVDPW